MQKSQYNHVFCSENYHYPWNGKQNNYRKNPKFKKYGEMLTNYIFNPIDMIFWESFMNDGGKPEARAIELHIRHSAYVNAVWGGLDTIGSCEGAKTDKEKTSDIPFSNFQGYGRLKSDEYIKYMGIIHVSFSIGAMKMCGDNKIGSLNGRYSNLKINWHANAKGHRVEADILAYYLLKQMQTFINKYRNDINSKLNNINDLDEYLRTKSGNWGDNIYKNPKLFPKPFYCGYKNKQSTCGDTGVIEYGITSMRPYLYNNAFRMQDYVVNELNNTVKWLTIDNQWKWSHKERNDRMWLFYQLNLGEQGSMDLRAVIQPNPPVFRTLFLQDFIKGYHKKVYDSIQNNIQQNETYNLADYGYYTKYQKEWANWQYNHNFGLKINIMIPKNGNHSLMLVIWWSGQSFGINKAYGVYLDKIEGSDDNIGDIILNDDEIEMNTYIKQKKEITSMRPCIDVRYNCVIYGVPPGKYVVTLVIYNMNYLETGIAQLVGF